MKRKIIILSLTLAVIVLSVSVLPNVLGLQSNIADSYYGRLQERLDYRLSTATMVFMLSKIISGMLTFFQSVEIDISAMVAGINLNPLTVLQPINNTINKLSDLYLMAMGAIVLEKFLMVMGGWLTFKIIVPLAAVVFAISEWITGVWKDRFQKISLVFLFSGIVIWGTIPLSLEISAALEKYFLADIVNRSTESLQKNSADLDSMKNILTEPKEAGAAGENPSMWDRAKSMLALSKINEKVEEITKKVSEKMKTMINDLLTTLTVMILTTLIIPVGTLLCMWWLLKWLMGLVSN